VSTIHPASAAANTSVQSAIREASQRTDTDFDYLLAQARIESALDPSARARTSSAAGLYQFTNQTWLETLQRHGHEHGLGWAANAISTQGGRARITDPGLESAIMQLRFDPQSASLMAAELAGDNGAFLQSRIGREADHTELYLAHFLGAEGARKFITAHEADPSQSAAKLFPAAARSNRGVFYNETGERSLGEVRDMFATKLDRFGADADAMQPIASASRARSGARFSPLTPASAQPAQGQQTQGQQTQAPARPSMSAILQDTFGTAGGRGQPPAHVANAYDKIARFGL